ncbi:uncharacterized protein LOC110451088 isoform X2 [Mizuhopecten yessoensis]|uniref:EF-hand domain-containing protein n=2 Tax=Mizuhopecten yessoensis TaxID=6573 RepID=A0A210QMG2_MIZYE|nr:uncharacterized protein LOC110451088 isoform X2 [Mizuhopecten yessoensis]OWF49918.1 hypothetical protein KP79_PYT04008 [Mizuhopecten yessoensis]
MQLLIFVLGFSSVFAAPLDTHQHIITAVDHSFTDVDTDRDGIIQLSELEASFFHVDFDGNKKVSESEFESRSTNHTFRKLVFLELDYDGDGFLDVSAIQGEYTVMDTNADNLVSRREFDTYYTKVIETAIAKYGFLIGITPIPPSSQ